MKKPAVLENDFTDSWNSLQREDDYGIDEFDEKRGELVVSFENYNVNS